VLLVRADACKLGSHTLLGGYYIYIVLLLLLYIVQSSPRPHLTGLESIRDASHTPGLSSARSVQSVQSSKEWRQKEASILQLESQQRKLKREISLLGPRQQEHMSARGGGAGGLDNAGGVAVEEIGGLPRSGWEIRQIEQRYRLLKKLKGGAMALVYLAEDKATRAFYHEVVLKVLKAGGTFEQRQRMIREVSLVGSVRHPNVVQYQDAAEQPDGTLFIAMEVIQGRDLQRVIDANKRLHPIYTIEVVTGVLKGLKALHEKQIVHRDLKPANVIVSPETGHVKIIDLGLAKSLLTSSMLTGDNVVCVLVYMCMPFKSFEVVMHALSYMHACMHACMRTYVTYIRTYIHTYIHTYTHTCIHAYIHTCIHTYILTDEPTNDELRKTNDELRKTSVTHVGNGRPAASVGAAAGRVSVCRVFVVVCVCMCVRASERGKRVRQREREKERTESDSLSLSLSLVLCSSAFVMCVCA